MTNAPLSLTLTEFGRFELLNALRAARFRGVATSSQLAAGLRAFRQDLAASVLVPTACDWTAVFAAASRLSARFTAAGGHRALDVLHVAVARQLGAGEFPSFDVRQRALAAQVGLNVRP